MDHSRFEASNDSACGSRLTDVHVYRDSLRWRGLPAHSAYIVTPSLAENTAVYGGSAYQSEHRFGAIVLGSSSWSEFLRELGVQA